MAGPNKRLFRLRPAPVRGWNVVGAPECPVWEEKTDAVRYCNLRNKGVSHQAAFDKVDRDRQVREKEDQGYLWDLDES
jgi:hypothetical protein